MVISRRTFVGGMVLSVPVVTGRTRILAHTGASSEPDMTSADRAVAVGSPAPSPSGPPPRRPPAEPESTSLRGTTAVALASLRHLVTVAATVNGCGPYRLAIDSGSAAALRVSSAVADELGLPQTGVMQVGDPASGRTTAVRVVRVEAVTIGSARFTGVEASVGTRLSDIEPDGIIGLALFARLTAAIAYPHATLTLSHARLPAAGPQVAGFTRPRGVPRVAVTASGVDLDADIDTGGPAVLTVPAVVRLPLAATPTVTGIGRTTNGQFTIRSAPLTGDLVVAGQTAHRPRVSIVDGIAVASIGAGFLHRYTVTFDLPNSRLALTT